jgi:2-hydroxychromene-2-carboxylate isomerase
VPPERLELWFDFSCPYAYLASHKAPGIARAAGTELAWKPMLLGGVFRGIGAGDGPMATLGPAKAAHNLRDMARWAAVFGVPFRVPAAHPMRTVRALRVLLGLPHSRWPGAIAAIYAAYWARAEDITRDEVIASALRTSVPDDEIAAAIASADSDAIKAELKQRTDEAIAHGIFGAPGWRVDGKLIWGQDRIPWVDAALAGWDLDSTPPNGARPFGSDVQPFQSPHAMEFYCDVSSPYAYFALTQLTSLARATGIAPKLHPILLGGLFRDIGQADAPLMVMTAPKQRYVLEEMNRWGRWWGVPFSMPTKFPQRTINAQRLCLVVEDDAQIRLAQALGRAMWAEQRDLENAETLREILDETGLPKELLERTAEPAIKAQLIAETSAAKAAGIFGVPSFVVNNHLVWGQDRLDLVMRYAAGWDVP